MRIRFFVPTLTLLFGISWLAHGGPIHLSELLPPRPNSNLWHQSTIGSMRPDNVLTVLYKSEGCFHRSTARLRITRAKDGAVRVSAYAHEGPFHDIGVLRRTLTVTEVDALDRLLSIYGTKRQGHCTTQTTLRFGLYHRGRHLLADDTIVYRDCLPTVFDFLVYEALDAGLW